MSGRPHVYNSCAYVYNNSSLLIRDSIDNVIRFYVYVRLADICNYCGCPYVEFRMICAKRNNLSSTVVIIERFMVISLSIDFVKVGYIVKQVIWVCISQHLRT